MKVRLKEDYDLHGTHKLRAGTILEVLGQLDGCCDTWYRCLMPTGEDGIEGGRELDGTQQIIDMKLVDIVDYTPIMDWEDMRLKVAIGVLQGYVASTYRSQRGYVEDALHCADLFVEAWKKRMRGGEDEKR